MRFAIRVKRYYVRHAACFGQARAWYKVGDSFMWCRDCASNAFDFWSGSHKVRIIKFTNEFSCLGKGQEGLVDTF